MPDTLTPLDEFHLNLIRKYVAAAKAEGPFVKGGLFDMLDQLLAHIDALTAAVEALPVFAQPLGGDYVPTIDRAAVLAIFRGEQVDPDAEAEAEFLKPIKPQGL